ncbi:MAG: hypothetical protein IJZ52_03145, partial [Clostridium sp.]|nr:hypothetical protein [Clostridium sp.]
QRGQWDQWGLQDREFHSGRESPEGRWGQSPRQDRDNPGVRWGLPFRHPDSRARDIPEHRGADRAADMVLGGRGGRADGSRSHSRGR